MLRWPVFCILTIFLGATFCFAADLPLREGDIVFQTFPSYQSRAIELATKSEFSHVGIILQHHGRLMVYEAVGPVQYTAVDAWIRRNEHRHFVAKRLKKADSILTKGNLAKLESVASTFEGKPYDFVFGWSDEKLYCSELVWKIFHRALKIDVGNLRKLKDFDLSSAEVREILHERYPDGIPGEETVVSPQDILESGSLVTIYQQ
jgi:uncharacterized protein YycO